MTTEELDALEFSIPMAQIRAGRTKALKVRIMGLPTTGVRVPPEQWVECGDMTEVQVAIDQAIEDR